MRNVMTLAFIIALCGVAVCIGAQPQCELNYCSPEGVCPPTGNSMGQSNYQRSPYHDESIQPIVTPIKPEIVPYSTGIPAAVPETTVPKVELDATPGERQNITVDDQYIYVLQGDEVVKLDKSSLKVVSRTKINSQ